MTIRWKSNQWSTAIRRTSAVRQTSHPRSSRKSIHARCFVADVSIVTPAGATRLIPNPNVLLELGYASKAIGWERIVMVANTAFGQPEELPFDLRKRRVIPPRMNATPQREFWNGNAVELV